MGRDLLQKGDEEVICRRVHPLAANGRFFRCRDFLPIGDKPPEVVDSEKIEESEVVADPLNPPRVPGLTQDVPAIDRISPVLAGRTEVVGRNPGNTGGSLFFIELEKVRVRPDIGAVMTDIDRNIPDEFEPLYWNSSP